MDPAIDTQQRGTTPQPTPDIETAIDQARTACRTTGEYSSECAAAWDAVEEMQAARAQRQSEEASQTSFQRYCQEHPDADECRIYDV